MPKVQIAILVAVISWGTSARAADPGSAARHYLFPTPGDVTLTTAIGVPYLAVTEISVGITRSFSTGVLFAVADEIGVGIRPRFAVLTAGPAMLALAVPIVYYPPMSKRDGQDWLYANPQLRLDLALPQGARLYAGAGVVLAACTDSVAALLRGERPADQEARETAASGPKRRPMVGGVWTTVHFGGAIPVTPSLDVTFDGGMVLGGMTPRVEYAHRVGIPVLAELGIAKSF
jgi:hypothetical protein